MSISGTAQEGQTVTAVISGAEADDTLSYQWQSSADGGQTWSDIANATNASYQVQGSDEGHHLKVVATDTADNNGGTATASAATYISTMQEDDWATAANGNWETAGNWDNGVPSSSVAALIAVSGTYTVTISSSAAQAGSLTVNDSQATLAVATGDALTISGALTVDAGSLSLSGGTIQAASIDLEGGATLLGYGTVSGPISNYGLIKVFSAHTLDIAGNITGTGSIEVLNNTTLELDGSVASTQTLKFAQGGGATGTLVLDHSLTQPFSAVISNLGVNDYIDLKDLTFTSGHMTASTSYANGDTTLVVSNTSTNQSVTFTLAGNYTSSTWNFAQDSGTGTIFHDPPATDADAATVSSSTSTDLALTVTAALTTQDGSADQFTFQTDSQSGTLAGDSTLVASADDPSATDATTSDTTSNSAGDTSSTASTTVADTGATTNTQAATSDSTQTATTTQTASASPAATSANGDTFVFAANFGNATITNFHADTDAIEIDHTVFADFQALLAATQDDGHGNAVITADPHDTITIKSVTVAQLVQHQSDFHFT